jgi:chromosome segregation protein
LLLKRIEIDGFKSFADKTVIEVNKGITGIVGPNGSGKSNIADAVRWVLGEQNSRNLRGKRMEDVIFDGTETRRRRSSCSVRLLFDNEDGRFGTEYSEVVIGRRIFRGGESEYTINGQQVRLRDIVEMMKDTGIGKEGYSIIGQGRIDEILSSRPQARRKVFEEAAGIAKFRMRKEETESRLDKAEANLVRINDLLTELEQQLGPLSIQAEKTKRYSKLVDRIKVLDVNLFITNYDRFTQSIERYRNEAEELKTELELLNSKYGGANEEADRLAESQQSYEEKIRRINDEIITARAENERIIGEQKLFRERKEAQEQEKLRLKNDIGQSAGRVDELADMLKRSESEAVRLEEDQKKTEDLITSAEQKKYEAELEQGLRYSEMNSAKEKQLEIMKKISELRQELSRMESDEQNYQLRREDIEERIGKAKEDAAAVAGDLEKANGDLEAVRSKGRSVVSSLNELNAKRLKIEKDRNETESEIRRNEALVAQTVSRRKTLKEMDEDYQGYSDSVRNLMKMSRGRTDFTLYGTLAELIRVPQQYETAVEAALGSAEQNVVTPGEQDAKAAIGFLRQNRLGRVTFLPVDALKLSGLKESERRAAAGAVVASDVIGCDDSIRPAVEFLLARTVIVKDLDEAIALMRKTSYAFRTVTLEGDIIRPGGVMTGGNMRERNFGLLSRSRILEQLSGSIRQQTEKGKELRERMASLVSASEANDLEIRKLTDDLQSTQIEAAQIEERISVLDSNRKLYEDNAAQLERNLKRLDFGNDETQERRETISLEIEDSEAALNDTGKDLEEAEKQNLEAADRMNEVLQEIMSLNVKKAEISGNIENERVNADRIRAEIAEEKDKHPVLEALFHEAERRSDELAEQIESSQKEAAASELKLKQLIDENLKNEEELKEIRAKLESFRKDDISYRESRTSLTERMLRAESMMERAENARRASADKLWEDYELTYSSAAEMTEDIGPYTQATQELGKLRAELREMGSINPNAVEDYEDLKERVEGLKEQKGDLESAEADMREIIDNLVKQMREQFKAKFDEINRAFGTVYKDLFGGGRANLSLEDGDIMECGIEIQAEPSGKKLQHIELLSGGEKALTAIAIIFAMLKVNPSPVCLLDEIDAPLDELNVARLSDYFRRLSDSQFIVITHRKTTMMACNVLYGTAMEEKGVTGMVSVEVG